MQTVEKPTRPILRYHGGKWMLAPWIISHFPKHDNYVEPFAGAASVLMRKPRTRCECINDIDEDVVNLFQVLRNAQTARELCDALELTPFSRAEFERAYEPWPEPVERARRMVVRAFQGFGSGSSNIDYSSGFRASSKQGGRPHALDWLNIPECLLAVTERLKGVVIECRDALEIIRNQDAPDILFYLDPPYAHSARPSSNRKQYKFEMDGFEHEALAALLKTIQGKAVISGYRCELYDRLYANWKRKEKKSRASGQRGSIERTEVLWMNF